MARVVTLGRRLALGAAALLVALTGACADGNGPTEAGGASGHDHGHGQPAPPPPPKPLRAGERFVTLTMPEPYTPAAPGRGTDEYRCFLVDPGLSSPAYLTGSQFLPQNSDIVHHAIFFRVPPQDLASAYAADRGDRGQGWRCFGDAGIDGENAWVAAWAPGADEGLLVDGVGYELPAGSQLVMQVHYNLAAPSGGSDQSGIRLRIADGTTEMTGLSTLQLPGPVELPCTPQERGRLCDRTAAIEDVGDRFGRDVAATAGQLLVRCSGGQPVPGPTQHCDYPMDTDATIYAAAGHMHLLGRSITVELNPGGPDAKTLLNVPVYNFDDQAVRPLSPPVEVKQGDVLRVTCTHDARLRQRLPQLRTAPPRYVVWGDGTSDEMCLGLVVAAPH